MCYNHKFQKEKWNRGKREGWGQRRATNPLVSRWWWGEVRGLVCGPFESSSADRGPRPAAILWQLDVILSSRTGLKSPDITAVHAAMCVCRCVRATPATQRLEPGQVLSHVSQACQLIMPFLPYGCVCAKWVVFCLIKYLQLQTEQNPRPAWHSCLIYAPLSSSSSHPVVSLF